MAWLILIVSGAFEAVWATALARSEGFTKLAPSLVFLGGIIVSLGGLAIAMRDLPTGTSYVVWVGIGAVLTVGYAMLTGAEPVSPLRIALILGVVGCVVGMKLISD